VVKTGFCQRDFSKTHEQQRHLKEKLFSEQHEEVKSIKTSKKNTFFPPQQKLNFIFDFRLRPSLSAFCEHDVQSSTVARRTDLMLYIVYSRN